MSSYSARYACFRSNAACAVLLRTGPPRSNHCGSLVAPFFVHSDSRLPRLLLLSTNTSGLASGLGSQLRHRALLSLWPSLRNGLSARLRASETQGPSSHAPVSDQTRAVQAALWPRPPCQPRASRHRPQTAPTAWALRCSSAPADRSRPFCRTRIHAAVRALRALQEDCLRTGAASLGRPSWPRRRRTRTWPLLSLRLPKLVLARVGQLYLQLQV